ncbi:MAG TPA: MBL fold metallo-hydrolase [Anaerolineae bacterium]|nr:MBL fold metallo-hydrolase [Anaerolineae bacterium]
MSLAVPGYLHTITVPTPFPIGPVNVYLAEGAPLTLVDVGPRYEPARAALKRGLAAHGHQLAEVGRIVLTHAHADHSGLAAEVARLSGAEVLTHALNIPWLDGGSGARRLAFYADVLRWAGVPPQMLLRLSRMRRGMSRYEEPLTPDGTLSDGDVLRLGDEEWVVLHTPGHTGGLICLHQPRRRLLLSSDHLLRHVSSNPIVEPPPPGEKERPRRLVDYLTQLRRVAALDIALALPGHGPVINDVAGLVRERLAFHERRARQVMDALGDEELTVHQLVERLFPALDPVNYFLAASEVIGHLQWLEERGEVQSQQRLRVAYWRRRRE